MTDWAKEEDALLKALGCSIGREKLIRLLPPAMDQRLTQLAAVDVMGISKRLASLRAAIQANYVAAERSQPIRWSAENHLPNQPDD